MKSIGLSVLSLSIAAGGFSSGAVSIDGSSWNQLVGSAALSGASSTGLVWGNNTSDNANNSFLVATLDGNTSIAGNQTVSVNVGETLTFAGTIDLSGTQPLTTGSLQFRFGLFNTNSSATAGFGWLGYFVGNGTLTNNGGLYAKNSGNSTGYIVESGSSLLTSFEGEGAALSDGIYTFSLSLQRTADSMVISTSLIRQSDGVPFATVDEYEHIGGAAPVLSQFDRIGFLAGDGLDADRVTLSNLSVAIIPEPAAPLLASFAALGLLRRRRS
jgi:hypothetical protein